MNKTAASKRYRQTRAEKLLELSTAQILAALRRTMSLRSIESSAGVDRGTLSRIASGERSDGNAATYRSLAILALKEKIL